MKLQTLLAISCIGVFYSLYASSNSSIEHSADVYSILEKGDALCGVGEAREVFDDAAWIRLRPQENVEADFNNLQWAVDNVASGGTIELCEGEFYLGENTERKTVTITKGVRLSGKKHDNEWVTIIKGGGSERIGLPDPMIGPFLVKSENDLNPVKFHQVWLRDWTSEAIVVEGCNGFYFEDSKLTHPVVSGLGYPFGATHFIHAILTLNPTSQGELVVRNNDVDLSWQYGLKPHDTNFVTAFGLPATAFRLMDISHNHIVTNDEAFEITANDAGVPSVISIENNDIVANFDVEGNWPLHFAVFVAGNRNTDLVSIKHNRLTLSNQFEPSATDAMGAFILTGENVEVTDNHIQFDDFSGKAFQVGNLGNLLLVDFGSDLTNSLIADNWISGELSGPGLHFTGRLRNRSTGNIFDLNTSLAQATQGVTVDILGARACRNRFEGDLGTVRGDLSRRCFLSF